MRRALLGVLLALALLAFAAGCGDTEVVREPAVVVSGDQPARPAADRPTPDSDAIRIAVVTHGQASSSFWGIVRNGVEAAGRQMDVLVDYRAPDIYNLERQRAMVDEAAASHPDGMVVSLPEPGIAPAVRRAVRQGIPVVTINSGSTAAKGLGALAHVGQPEARAGYDAGRRLLAAGVRHALCINQQPGNVGLDDRCRGLTRAMRAAGATSLVLGVDDQDPTTTRRIENALTGGRIDGLLALNATTALQAIDAVRRSGRANEVRVGSFDLTPEVLQGVQSRRVLFAVDQQAYLQGYLPVVMLTQRARYGLFPATAGGVIPTGPNFVTSDNAAKVIELAKRSIR
jgi:simple sugar transport system substrate-binding protein